MERGSVFLFLFFFLTAKDVHVQENCDLLNWTINGIMDFVDKFPEEKITYRY